MSDTMNGLFEYKPENDNSVASNFTATREKQGFGESLSAEFANQTLANSSLSAEHAYNDLETQNIQRANARGYSVNPLSGIHTNYLLHGDTWNSIPYWQAFNNQQNNNPELQKTIQDYDNTMNKLKKLYPNDGFQTSQEIIQNVKQNAQQAEANENMRQTNFSGKLGTILGSVIPSLSFSGYNNIQSILPNIVGAGVGSNIAKRLAFNTALGAGLNTANDYVFGVGAERKALGLKERTIGEDLISGAEGGLTMGLLGEGVSKLLSRNVNDNAPIPSLNEENNSTILSPPIDNTVRLPSSEDASLNQLHSNNSTELNPELSQQTNSDLSAISSQLDNYNGKTLDEVERLSPNISTFDEQARNDLLNQGFTHEDIIQKMDEPLYNRYMNAKNDIQELNAKREDLMQNSTYDDEAKLRDSSIVDARQNIEDLQQQIKTIKSQKVDTSDLDSSIKSLNKQKVMHQKNLADLKRKQKILVQQKAKSDNLKKINSIVKSISKVDNTIEKHKTNIEKRRLDFKSKQENEHKIQIQKLESKIDDYRSLSQQKTHRQRNPAFYRKLNPIDNALRDRYDILNRAKPVWNNYLKTAKNQKPFENIKLHDKSENPAPEASTPSNIQNATIPRNVTTEETKPANRTLLKNSLDENGNINIDGVQFSSDDSFDFVDADGNIEKIKIGDIINDIDELAGMEDEDFRNAMLSCQIETGVKK